MGLSTVMILSIAHIGGALNNNTLLKVTGAPGENTCHFCHTSFPNNSGGSSLNIQFNNGYNFYTPGATYNITVSLGGSSVNKYGFQMTSLKTSDQKQSGKFFPTVNTDTFYLQISTTNTNKRRYIEHKQNNSSGSWTFQWKAPSTNVGDIRFYGSGVAGQNPTGTVNDHAYSSTLTISPLLPPVAGFVASDTMLCAGDSTSFTNQSTSGSTLAWEFQGGIPATSAHTNPTVLYQNPGNYKVKLTVTNPLGSDSLVRYQYISVFAAPNLSVAATDITCYGFDDGTVTGLPAGGTAPYTYAWNTGNTSNSLTNLQQGTYCLTITDDNGCWATDCGQVAEPPVFLNTVQGTVVSCFNAFDGTVFCNTSGGTLPYHYLWNTGDTTAQVSALGGGQYFVTVTDDNGCSLTGNTTIQEPIEINTFTIITPVVGGLNNGAINLSVTGGIPPYTFSWSNGATTEDIDSLISGSYIVTITDDDNCTEIDTFFVNYSVGLQQNEDKQAIIISPNPAKESITISSTIYQSGEYEISILDLTGRQVLTKKWLVNGSLRHQVDIGHLLPGMYLLIVKAPDRKVSIFRLSTFR